MNSKVFLLVYSANTDEFEKILKKLNISLSQPKPNISLFEGFGADMYRTFNITNDPATVWFFPICFIYTDPIACLNESKTLISFIQLPGNCYFEFVFTNSHQF